jgi:hypothetical protein
MQLGSDVPQNKQPAATSLKLYLGIILGRAGLGWAERKPDSIFRCPGPTRPDCRVAFSCPGPARWSRNSSGHRAEPSVNFCFSHPRPGPTCFGPMGQAIFGPIQAGPGCPCPAIPQTLNSAPFWGSLRELGWRCLIYMYSTHVHFKEKWLRN